MDDKKSKRKAKKQEKIDALIAEGHTEDEAKAILKEQCAARKASRRGGSAAQVGSSTKSRLNTALKNAVAAPLTGDLALHGKHSLGQMSSKALDDA